MQLRTAIEAWDRRSAASIEDAYQRFCDARSFVSELIELVDQESAQTGATWMLKRYLDSGGRVDPPHVDRLHQALPELVDWASRLHVLQCLPHLPPLESRRDLLEEFLRRCLVDDNKFVRAWAYGGFHAFATEYPVYAAEAEQLLDHALQHEPASVRARIRKVRSQKTR